MSKRRMIKIDAKPNLFNFRIAGMAFRDGHVLVHRATDEKFWTFPGGRAEIGEESSETLEREMIEELERQVQVGPLVFIVENFFHFQKRRYHEIGFYYRMDVPEDFPFASGAIVHRIRDGKNEIEFKWVPATIAAMKGLPLQPSFISDRIEAPPVSTEHLVWREQVPE